MVLKVDEGKPNPLIAQFLTLPQGYWDQDKGDNNHT